MKDGGKNAFCCDAMGHMLLTAPGVTALCTFLRNTWNSQSECYQLKVYNITLATVRYDIQPAENRTLAIVISIEAAQVHIAIDHDYWTSKVALEEPEFRSTYQYLLRHNNCTGNKQHCQMLESSRNREDSDEEGEKHDVLPTTDWRCQASTRLKECALGTSAVDGNEVENGNNVHSDEEEEASQANDGSTQNVDD